MWFKNDDGELLSALLGGPVGAEAFILGAGFSRAISDSMPLVRDLVEPFNDFLATSRGMGVATYPRLENLEVFLSSLAMPQPFLDEAANSYNRGLFFETTRWLAEHMFRAQRDALAGEMPDWLVGLLRTWHARQSTVVTLNYDTLVESAILSIDLMGTNGRVLPQHCYANPVRFAAAEWAGTFNQYEGRSPTLSLCKLHGSLSWWRSGRVDQPPVDVEVWKDVFGSDSLADWDDVAGRVMLGAPMLVPPTLAKSEYFDNDLIRANWRRAYEGLSGAATIVAMGYSFPAGDVQMAALVGGATTTSPNKQIIVVDLSAEVASRVAEVALPRSGTIRTYHQADQPIVTWSEEWAAAPESIYGQPMGVADDG